MIFKEELAAMQENYEKKRLKNIRLKRPDWLSKHDPMWAIFKDKRVLLQKGSVCFACIVQANSMLFHIIPHWDCPACIVYSTSPLVAEDPRILWDLAHKLYSYKDKPQESVPEEWREIARSITDEYDRSEFTFSIEYNEHAVEIHCIPVMIFRKLLPRRKLCGSLLPILTTPESKTVMLLPKRYWTQAFEEAWRKGYI